ncbi:MAG: hypothetical protein ACXVZ2_00395 [Gaiellaceae bacterium]
MTKDAALASAIYEYITAPSDIAPDGPIEVRVDVEGATGILFISMPYHDGDRDLLTKLMVRARDGFARNEIPTTHRVTVGEDERFDAFDDEGRRLLHLPANLTVEPRS